MRYEVRFYETGSGEKPVANFIKELRKNHPHLYASVTAGLKKIERREYHSPPLTELVDPEHDIFELRVGRKNIARVFFFFQPGQVIIPTNGYVKKRQKLDPGKLQLARDYKKDWEERRTA